MANLPYSRLQLRRGDTDYWSNNNPILSKGEPGIEFITKDGTTFAKIKIGDGGTNWKDLPYACSMDGKDIIFTKEDDPDLNNSDINTIINIINNKLNTVAEGAQVNVLEKVELGTSVTGTVEFGTDDKAKTQTINITKVSNAGTADMTKGTLTIFSKTFNGSADVTVTETDIGAATYAKLGLVKSSTGNDHVAVATDGTMTVSKVSSAANADKVASPLTIGSGENSKTFDGSTAQTITLTDLGFDESKYAIADDLVGKKDTGGEIFNDYINNTAQGTYAHAEGYYTAASGEYSHAEGESTAAFGDCSHAEGCETTASSGAAHAEGWKTTAFGDYSHVEGLSSNSADITVENLSHATNDTIISIWDTTKFSLVKGIASHVEGKDNLSFGDGSHAEGYETIAKGNSSHAEGKGTIAASPWQHVQGKYNLEDTTNTYAHIVGGGTEEDIKDDDGNIIAKNRKNIHTLDWNGTAWFANDVIIKGKDQDNDSDDTSRISLSDVNVRATGIGRMDTTSPTGEIFNDYINNTAQGTYAHAEGNETIAKGESSHAEGYAAIASGDCSHAEGHGPMALGNFSHAEGDSDNSAFLAIENLSYQTDNDTIVSKWNDGNFSLAKGLGSHVEGRNNLALGDYSHAEGYETIAKGNSSHAEGEETIAASLWQHVQGKYNIEDTANKYAHIVGNGEGAITNESGETIIDRSNAHTLDWNGNAWFAGDIKIEGTSYDDAKTIATTEYVDNAFKTTKVVPLVMLAQETSADGSIKMHDTVSVSYDNTDILPYPYAIYLVSTYDGHRSYIPNFWSDARGNLLKNGDTAVFYSYFKNSGSTGTTSISFSEFKGETVCVQNLSNVPVHSSYNYEFVLDNAEGGYKISITKVDSSNITKVDPKILDHRGNNMVYDTGNLRYIDYFITIDHYGEYYRFGD